MSWLVVENALAFKPGRSLLSELLFLIFINNCVDEIIVFFDK